MKDYLNFEVVDFVQDDQFLKWVKHPALYPELDRFWKAWISEHHEKVEEIEEARRMVLAVVEEGEEIHISSRQEAVLIRLRASIQDSPVASQNFVRRRVYMTAAAITAVVLSVGAYFLWQRAPDVDDQLRADWNAEDFIKEINNGEASKTVVLADGSSIVLLPNSTLQYPRTFDKKAREVALTGEGFFEISKDVNRPFLVYTDKLITKVLGTSFSVRSFNGEKNILVKVRTGKVSVVERTSDAGNNNDTVFTSDGVLLTPNQQVVFLKDESKFVKSLVDEPLILNSMGEGDFTFSDTPVGEVFSLLEEAYGVDIVYNEELMRDCLLNGSIEDMHLYDKLRLICKSVNAKYELVDSHIVITGQGCKDQ